MPQKFSLFYECLYIIFIQRPRDLQEIILVSPMGVSKLMDLLGDNREVIRNDVSTTSSQIFVQATSF